MGLIARSVSSLILCMMRFEGCMSLFNLALRILFFAAQIAAVLMAVKAAFANDWQQAIFWVLADISLTLSSISFKDKV